MVMWYSKLDDVLFCFSPHLSCNLKPKSTNVSEEEKDISRVDRIPKNCIRWDRKGLESSRSTYLFIIYQILPREGFYNVRTTEMSI